MSAYEEPARGELETRRESLPMRWPTRSREATVDVTITSEISVRWSFRTAADQRAYWQLDPAERDELRQGFDAAVAGMLDRKSS